jgi:lysophospholipase L1-like esterase
MKRGLTYFFITALLTGSWLRAQDNPYASYPYYFLHLAENKLDYAQPNPMFDNVFDTLDAIQLKGEGQLRVLHIGDSHIQADYFSGRIRREFQRAFMAGSSQGLIFPYRVARTNSPDSYYTFYTGKWSSCRITKNNCPCSIGIAGYSVSTTDTLASVSIMLKKNGLVNPDFTRVMIYHSIDSLSPEVDIEQAYYSKYTYKLDDSIGYTEFYLKQIGNEIKVKLIRKNPQQRRFVLHGFYLPTDEPGIIYNSIGVNGAGIASYQRCTEFSQELKTLNPQLVIVSLGTNDGNVKYFSPEPFVRNYTRLLRSIRETCPQAAIILTVPGDSYRSRRYINHSLPDLRNTLYQIARDNHCAVWDLYTVMGGMNSIQTWYRHGLAARDRIHLTQKGYTLQGDLFFNAFLKAYDEHIEANSTRLSENK